MDQETTSQKIEKKAWYNYKDRGRWSAAFQLSLMVVLKCRLHTLLENSADLMGKAIIIKLCQTYEDMSYLKRYVILMKVSHNYEDMSQIKGMSYL